MTKLMFMKKANSAESSTTVPYKSFHRRSVAVGRALLGLNISTTITSSSNNHVCSLCSRAFSSSQALGGHQNAHRKERNDVRMHYIRQRLENLKNIINNTSTTTWAPTPPEEGPGMVGFTLLLKEPEAGPVRKSGYPSNNHYYGQYPYNGKDGGQYNNLKSMQSLELTLAVGTEQGRGADHEVMTSSVEELDLTLRL